VCRVSDPLAQQIHRGNAKRMLLVNFVAGELGVPGKSDSQGNRPVKPAVNAIALVGQLTRARAAAWVNMCTALVTLLLRKPLAILKPKPHSNDTNASAWGTFLENVPQGTKGKLSPLTRQEVKATARV